MDLTLTTNFKFGSGPGGTHEHIFLFHHSARVVVFSLRYAIKDLRVGSRRVGSDGVGSGRFGSRRVGSGELLLAHQLVCRWRSVG
jgi:hypothetical protein